MALAREQYKIIANNFLRGLGFRENSDAFLEDMADRIYGFPDSEMVSQETQMNFLKRGDLEFQTDAEREDYNGNICGYVSIVSDGEYAYTKIPYTVDKNTGKVDAKLPDCLSYAQDEFDALISEIQKDHQKAHNFGKCLGDR